MKTAAKENTRLKLKASARIKRRYMLIDAPGRDVIEKAILDYIGILGWAKASPFFLKEENGRFILAVERSELNKVRASFELSGGKIKVERVSGTIKGLKI